MIFKNEEEKELYNKIVKALDEYTPSIGISGDVDTFCNIEKRLIIGFVISDICTPIEFDPSLNTNTDLYDENDEKMCYDRKIIPSNTTILKVYGHIPCNCVLNEFLSGSYGCKRIEIGYEYPELDNQYIDFIGFYKSKCILSIYEEEKKQL